MHQCRRSRISGCRPGLYSEMRAKRKHLGRLLTAGIAGAAVLVFGQAGVARAETLAEALAAAYAGNPTLAAERAQLRATDEGLAQARSGWRPNVAATGSTGKAWSDSGTGTVDLDPLSYGLSVDQPLYRGGQTVAESSRAKNLIMAGRAQLRAVEQSVLLEAAAAYVDVLRDTAVLELNIKSEQVLKRELDATRDRRAVGATTLTDVAQAEARVAGATAGRIQALGNLESARAVYARVIGHPPQNQQQPSPLRGLPRSLREALALADERNPELIGARHVEEAARDDVRLSKGALLPTLSLNGQVQHSEESSSPDTETDSASVTAQLRVPLYQAGGASARVRQAKQSAVQQRIRVEEASRAVDQEVTQAWEALDAARAGITQFEIQVGANEIALGGTRQQARYGSRILLDVLNAEQELRDAQVNLVRAQRDAFVAELRLLAAVGRLTARDLALPVEYYNEEAYYDHIKRKLWGTGIGSAE